MNSYYVVKSNLRCYPSPDGDSNHLVGIEDTVNSSVFSFIFQTNSNTNTSVKEVKATEVKDW